MQAAYCLVVLFAAGLFVGTLNRLAIQPLGFSAERLLALETKSARPRPPEVWDQVAEQLRAVSGVESVALAGWPLLSGNGSNGTIWVNGEPTEVLAYFLGVSPEWRRTMGIALLSGRDFRARETSPGVALVNEAFVEQCFAGANPIGKYFDRGNRRGNRFQVVGIVRNARYRNLREPITPTAYIPFRVVNGNGEVQPVDSAAFIVRTVPADPLSLAAALRREVPRARSELWVSNLHSQLELNGRHTLRERLLASLALFFAVVALLLASVGLHGVLDYSVLQRRREIGIRLAIGAPLSDIVWHVASGALSMVFLGSCAGVALGIALGRFAGTILYGVKPADTSLLATPALAILTAAILAALPSAIRAVRIDPVSMLRSD
jgi:predicted permease